MALDYDGGADGFQQADYRVIVNAFDVGPTGSDQASLHDTNGNGIPDVAEPIISNGRDPEDYEITLDPPADTDSVIATPTITLPEPELVDAEVDKETTSQKERTDSYRVDTSFSPLPKDNSYTNFVARYFGIGRE